MRKVRIAAMHFEALLVMIDSYYCWEKPVRSENTIYTYTYIYMYIIVYIYILHVQLIYTYNIYIYVCVCVFIHIDRSTHRSC